MIAKITSALVILGWFVAAQPAEAGCLGVKCSCTVSGSPVTFGVYNPMAAGDIDVASDISVTCNSFVIGLLISYDVYLGPGVYGAVLDRKMSNGSSLLAYNLYTNSGRTTVWGDGAGGTSMISKSYLLGLGGGRTDTFTAYGRLPAGQNVSAGAYSDTIVATVVF